jgi:hypothetical protein
MRARIIVLCLVLLGALLAACGGDSSKATAKLIFEFDDGVSESDRRFIRDTTEAARRYFKRETGRDIRHDVTVTTTFEPSLSKTALGGFKRITIHLNDGWLRESEYGLAAVTENMALVAHEYFHALQNDLIWGPADKPDPRATISPSWIYEGSAMLAGYRYVADQGLIDLDATITALEDFRA